MSLSRLTAAGRRQRLPNYGSCLHWTRAHQGDEGQQTEGLAAAQGQVRPQLPWPGKWPKQRAAASMWPHGMPSGAGTGTPSSRACMSSLQAASLAAAQEASLTRVATAAAAAAIEEQRQQQQQQSHGQVQLPLSADLILPLSATTPVMVPPQHRQWEQEHERQRQQQQQQPQEAALVASPATATATAMQTATATRPWLATVALCATAAAIMYADRSSISTAILPMSEQFSWDKRTGGAVMSAFLAGYGATQMFGGFLSDKYGGKAVLAAGLGIWSLATLLTPAAAAHSAGALLGVRAVLGLGQGVAFPAIHAMIAKGVPTQRRSQAIGAVMACAFGGSALAFGSSPGLIHALGWPSVFYCFSAASVVWIIAALRMRVPGSAHAAQQPPQQLQPHQQQGQAASVLHAQQHPHQQQHHNHQQQQHYHQDAHHQQQQQQQSPSGIWPLLRRKEVWAIAATQYCISWGFFGLLAWLPTFFSEHFGLELAQLGSYTIMPYLLQGAVAASAGVLADYLMHKRKWRVRRLRVGMQTVAMVGPAACLMAAVSPLGAGSPELAAGLITLGMGMSALTCNGVSANHLDIAPNNSGKVFGVGNTAGTLAGILSVPATGALLHATGSWPLVFGIAAAHNVVGAAIFARWCGSSPLPEDGGHAAAAVAAISADGASPAAVLLEAGQSGPAHSWHEQEGTGEYEREGSGVEAMPVHAKRE